MNTLEKNQDNHMMKFKPTFDLQSAYLHTLKEKQYDPDSLQIEALTLLEELVSPLLKSNRLAQSSLKQRFLQWFKKTVPHTAPQSPTYQGVYLWGGVGRGKSFVMDIFFKSIPIKEKIRIHFHEFMSSVHAEIRKKRGIADPIEAIAKELIQRYNIICFDEFHVSDIADAMILKNLLQALLDQGMLFVMTSNTEPSQLYLNGLHRDRFLPAIELIETQFKVFQLDRGTDYRILKSQSASRELRYLTPINQQTTQVLSSLFQELASSVIEKNKTLIINDRPITALSSSSGMVWFDFETLCGSPRSHEDYLTLCQNNPTLFLSAIPALKPEDSLKTKRFIWLIDVCYDHYIRLIIQAQVPKNELYTSGLLYNEFQRTLSRLNEMGTEGYWQQASQGGYRSKVTL